MQSRLADTSLASGKGDNETMQATPKTDSFTRDEALTLVGSFKAFRGRNLRRGQPQAAPPDPIIAAAGPPCDLKGVKSAIDKIAPSVRSVKAAFDTVDSNVRALLLRFPRDLDGLDKLKNNWTNIKEVSREESKSTLRVSNP